MSQVVITVRLFASYADKLGIQDTQLDLREPARVSDVLHSISRMPGGATLPPKPLVAVNQIYATLDTALSSGDEVAIIPPVSGG